MSAVPPKLDFDALMARIRTNTELRVREPKGSRPAALSGAGPEAGGNPNASSTCTAQELFALPETEYVRACYLALLGREARPEELDLQRDRLLTWQASRLRVLRDLRASPEGRAHSGRIPGLWRILLWDRIYWSPPAKAQRALWKGIGFLLQLKMRVEAAEQAGAAAKVEVAKIRAEQASDRRAALNQARHMQERISAIRELGEDGSRQLVARAESIEQALAQASATLFERTEAIGRAATEFENELRPKLIDHWRAIVDQKLRTEALLTALRAESRGSPEISVSREIEREKEHLLDSLYLSFEDRYRGSRDEVKKRQRVYLPRVESCMVATGGGLVIDIGCGRGEWLELLKESGITAEGYDLNGVAVEECRERGLNVVRGDGLEALGRQPESSLCAITSFHVIEHLPFENLVSMLDHALRALRPGGVLILETPNPANLLVAAERFYFDPTHRNPLPSELVGYLLTARGFADVEIVPLHPVNWTASRNYDDPMLGLLQDKLFGPQDYGVIGWKAAS